MAGTRHAKVVVALAVLARFLIYAQRMVVAPFFYRLMDRFDAGYLEMGALLTLFFVGYAVSQLPAGLAADRFQARNVIIWGLGLLGLGSLVFIYSTTLTWALVGRFIMGVASALCYTPGMKLVASNTGKEQRGAAIGLVQSAVGLSLLCTQMLFPILVNQVSLNHLFLSLTLLSPALMLAFWIVKPESESGAASADPSRMTAVEARSPCPQPAVTPSRPGLRIEFIALLVVAFLGLLAANGIQGWLPSFINKPLGFGESGAGMVMGVMLTMHTLSSYFSGRLSDQLGKRVIVINAGASIIVLSLLALMLHPQGWVIYPVVAVLGLGMGGAIAPVVVLASELYGTRKAGFVIGAMNTAGQAASAVGGLLFGFLLDTTGAFWIIWAVAAAALVVRILATSSLPEDGSSMPVTKGTRAL